MPMESTVGTFRITQPGSSVATSLTTGESERKQVGILDVRGNDFRLRPIPLSQVRAFVASEISLSSYKEEELDPEDPNVDEIMKNLLHERVKELIEDARGQARSLQEDADEEAKRAIPGIQVSPRNYAVQKPDQVLVRLKVEHSGFTTLNNQRFGAKFVNEVVSSDRSPVLVCESGFVVCIVTCSPLFRSHSSPVCTYELTSVNIQSFLPHILVRTCRAIRPISSSSTVVARLRR